MIITPPIFLCLLGTLCVVIEVFLFRMSTLWFFFAGSGALIVSPLAYIWPDIIGWKESLVAAVIVASLLMSVFEKEDKPVDSVQ